jgi:ABC-2 type transport system permease protein
MKLLTIAIKDLTRSFRSTFAVVFMFGVPLLMTGMFSMMFGGSGSGKSSFTVPVTTVAVADLDEGSPSFTAIQRQLPSGSEGETMGQILTSHLEDKGLADILQIMRVDSAEAARAAVDSQQAGAAIIIPADFSAQFADINGSTSIELYKDPTLTIGPGIVQSVLNQLLDSFSGAKIAVTVAVTTTGQADQAFLGQIVRQFSGEAPSAPILDIQDVAVPNKQANATANIIGPIMGWLTLFYAFFTGTSTAQSILKEDEEGTLPRLFTTPTKHSTILGGKFLAVGLTVVVQMVTLFLLGRLIFGIAWGSLASIALVIFGTILAASGFGIFANSMLKTTKQSGLIFGGLLTVLGMLGGLPIFVPGATANSPLAKVGLFEPVGWAVRGMLQSMQNAAFPDVALSSLVLAGWGILFFVVGVLRFQKRYA